MNKKIVEIICDGNQKIGFGHIRRSSALAASLRKENIPVRLVGLSEEARKLLPANMPHASKPAILVFDVAEGIEMAINQAKQDGQTVVTLDWFGNAVPDINIAVYPHSEVKALKEKYIGFDYIILREEIRNLLPGTPGDKTNNVLICLGGGDLLGQGFDTALFLKKNGFTVTLVQGPLAKNIPGDHGFTLLINPPDFPQLLAGCDWAVTNGAGCLFEALYLEKKVYVLPQTEWEMRIAVFVKKQGGVLGIGQDALKDFLTQNLLAVEEKNKKMVDGQGVDRITAVIKKLL
jgi:spore coat polysaccharide biosynthesis predicted glycosyltransferase SpsG